MLNQKLLETVINIRDENKRKLVLIEEAMRAKLLLDNETIRKAKILDSNCQTLIKLLIACINAEIDLEKRYHFTPNVCLQFYVNPYDFSLSAHFYFIFNDWLYENYVSSHSGLNKWINQVAMAAVMTVTRNVYGFEHIYTIDKIQELLKLCHESSWKLTYIQDCIDKAVHIATKHFYDGEEKYQEKGEQ